MWWKSSGLVLVDGSKWQNGKMDYFLGSMAQVALPGEAECSLKVEQKWAWFIEGVEIFVALSVVNILFKILVFVCEWMMD